MNCANRRPVRIGAARSLDGNLLDDQLAARLRLHWLTACERSWAGQWLIAAALALLVLASLLHASPQNAVRWVWALINSIFNNGS